MAFLQRNQLEKAEILCSHALEKTPQKDTELLLIMAAIQVANGKLVQARHYCKAAIDVDPSSVPAFYNYAIACHNLGDTNSAIAAYRRTIELQPDHAGAHGNLGVILSGIGDHDMAVRHLELALARQPHNHKLHHHLGMAYRHSDRYAEAELHFRCVLQHAPEEPHALNELGNLLLARNRPEEAIRLYSILLKRMPGAFVAHFNMSMALRRLGRHSEALSHSLRALQLEPDQLQARQAFAQSVQMRAKTSITDEMRKEIGATLGHNGIDSQQLFTAAAGCIKNGTSYKQLLAYATSGNVSVFSSAILDHSALSFYQDEFLHALLSNTIVTDLDIEELFTITRKVLLDIFVNGDPGHIFGDLLPYLCAQAHQCFNNEYVWQISDKEKHQLGLLNKILEEAQAAATLTSDFNTALLALLASYETLGIHKTWFAPACNTQHAVFASPVQDIIRRQVIEPAEEHDLAQQINSMSGVADAVSLRVQDQYEESPYPRWVSTTIHRPRPLQEILGEQLPGANLPISYGSRIDMLIAGCGTGSHAIQSATRFCDVSVTAIDLSRASLAYAMRKTREYNITNIEYYQADILELAGLDRRFQIIESVGVLHHMHDPSQGLQILASLLEPHGLFCVGLYSTTARRHISAARELVEELGLPATPEGIREARKIIKQTSANNPLRMIMKMEDFYSLSECRDLIFHVQEHTFTLLEIDVLLKDAGLEFIGFELPDPATFICYQNSYPDDILRINLKNWHRFELANPDTFIGMYNFWCKKPDRMKTPVD